MKLQDKIFLGSRGHREGTRRASGKGHGEWVQEDQQPGEQVGSRQREQKCEELRGDGKPGTGGTRGTEEVARSWATRSQLGSTELEVLTLQAECQSCIP